MVSWYNEHTDEAFAGQQPYLYPTYWRDDTFLEKLAFWTSNDFEHPAPPAGLRPASERRTYEDDNEPSDAGGTDGGMDGEAGTADRGG